MITTVMVEVAGGRPGAARSGSVRSAAAAKWWPGWPVPYAYPHGGLGAPGSHLRMRQSAQ